MKNLLKFLVAIPCAAIPALYAGFLHFIIIYGSLMEVKDTFWGVICGIISIFVLCYAEHWIQFFYPYFAILFFKLMENFRRLVYLQVIFHLAVVVYTIYLLCTHFNYEHTSQYIFAGILVLILIGLHIDYISKGLSLANS